MTKLRQRLVMVAIYFAVAVGVPTQEEAGDVPEGSIVYYAGSANATCIHASFALEPSDLDGASNLRTELTTTAGPYYCAFCGCCDALPRAPLDLDWNITGLQGCELSANNYCVRAYCGFGETGTYHLSGRIVRTAGTPQVEEAVFWGTVVVAHAPPPPSPPCPGPPPASPPPPSPPQPPRSPPAPPVTDLASSITFSALDILTFEYDPSFIVSFAADFKAQMAAAAGTPSTEDVWITSLVSSSVTVMSFISMLHATTPGTHRNSASARTPNV
eukprot:gene4816-5884_t